MNKLNVTHAHRKLKLLISSVFIFLVVTQSQASQFHTCPTSVCLGDIGCQCPEGTEAHCTSTDPSTGDCDCLQCY